MQEGQPIIINTTNSPSNVQVASLQIKSDSDFRTIGIKLKKIDGIVYCQYPDLSALSALDPKIVLMRKPKETSKKIGVAAHERKRGWVVCSKASDNGMSIVDSYLRNAVLHSQDAYHTLGGTIESYIKNNYVNSNGKFTNSRKKSQNAIFGICLRIDNPAYNGLKDNTTTSYYGIPRYLFSQVTPFRASIYQSNNINYVGIGIL